MDVRLDEDATESEADAIATALAEYTDDRVAVYVGDSDEAAATRDPPRVPNERYDDDAEPTDREERLRDEIADIERGGPKKYRDKLEEQESCLSATDSTSGSTTRMTARSVSRTEGSPTSTNGTKASKAPTPTTRFPQTVY